MAGRLVTVLDMHPSTTNKPMSNQDPNFTAPPNIHYYGYHTRSQTNISRSQTPIDTTKGLLHIHPLGQGHHAQTDDLQ